MKNTQLQSGEICCLAVSLAAFRIFTSLPLIFTRISGTGAPLSALLSGILAIFAALFVSRRLRGNSIFNIAKNPFARYTLSILALIYLALSALFTLTEFSQFAKTTAFPTTPLWFISLFFIVAAGVAAIKGLPPLLTICRYFIPVFVAVVFLLILSVFWNCDPSNLFPVLGNGLDNTFGKGISGILLYSDIPLIFLIDQTSAPKNKMRTSAMWGFVIGALVCFATVLAFTAKIPYPLSKDEQFPIYLIMKEVYYGRFFQRVDAVVQLISALWGMLSLSLHLCLITKIFEDTFEITSRPAALIPISAAIFFSGIADLGNISLMLLFSAAAFSAVLIFLTLFKEAKQNEK